MSDVQVPEMDSALLLMGLLAMQSTASKAEPRIGVATSTRPDAEGVIGANSQSLSPGSELYANETVRTGNVGERTWCYSTTPI